TRHSCPWCLMKSPRDKSEVDAIVFNFRQK
ncbi:MAG: hypothetical protein ACI9UJ_002020, partial [bacterium]